VLDDVDTEHCVPADVTAADARRRSRLERVTLDFVSEVAEWSDELGAGTVISLVLS